MLTAQRDELRVGNRAPREEGNRDLAEPLVRAGDHGGVVDGG